MVILTIAFISLTDRIGTGLLSLAEMAKKVIYNYYFEIMSQLTISDYEQRVLRLLELIDARQAMLKKHREAVEPSQLMIDEYTDLLRRHVDELDALMQEHGLSVQSEPEHDHFLQ